MNPLAFTYLGITVYHTRKDDARWSRLLLYWFSLSAEAFGAIQSFDVRELRAASQVAETANGRASWAEAVIRFAIESGELATSAIK